MEKVVIVIPTYNEREGIENTIRTTFIELSKISEYDCHILVVDADSPDGTATIISKLQKEYPKLHLLVKEKEGLGADYVAAFEYAKETLKPDLIGEFDGDLQHDPKDIKRLLTAISNGADVAVGSRFIKGGSIPKDWGLMRKFLSSVGNIYARIMTGMWSSHDITSGFRITRVQNVLNKIKLDELYSKRFAYKMDLYYRLYKTGAIIKEVPINFSERVKGSSKIQVFSLFLTNDWFDSYKVVTLILMERLGLIKYKRFVKVMIIGIVGALVQNVTYPLLRFFLHVPLTLALIISFSLAVSSNFYGNRHWSFKDRRGNSHWISEFIKFYASCLGSLLIQYLVLKGSSLVFGEGILREQIYLVIGIGLGLFWNYTISSKVIWQSKS